MEDIKYNEPHYSMYLTELCNLFSIDQNLQKNNLMHYQLQNRKECLCLCHINE